VRGEGVLGQVPAAAAAVVAVASFMCGVLMLTTRALAWRQRGSQTISSEAMRVPLADHDDLRRMLEQRSGGRARAAGSLLRIEGEVVPAKPEDQLAAPLSGRKCVVYAASISQYRHDSVHHPPVAFRSEGVDFAIKLASDPDLSIGLHSNDTALFGMQEGRFELRQAVAKAPEALRDFMLANLAPAAEGGDVSQQLAIRADSGLDGVLEFRESALLVGSQVVAVGEVAFDHKSGLRLYPWCPSGPPAVLVTKGGAQDPFVGRVMITDAGALSRGPPEGSSRLCPKRQGALPTST
jgi:hypothetical protein